MSLTRFCKPAALLAAGFLLACAPAHAAGSNADRIKAAIDWAKPVFGATCHFEDISNGSSGAAIYEIRYRSPGQDQDSPPKLFPLIQLPCNRDAANINSLFVTQDENGYRSLSFAEPKADFDYADEDFTQLKAPPTLAGFVTRALLSAARFDAASNTLTAKKNWRATGDAWSRGTWKFIDGEFVLQTFFIDPIFDSPGNPKTSNEAPYTLYKLQTSR